MWIQKSKVEGSYMESYGEKRIGTYLNLRSDTYAIAFLYQFHRYFLEDDCSDEEDAKEVYPEIVSKKSGKT